MSDRMRCPACGMETSSVLMAYMDDRPCPHCGLTADAAEQIMSIRARKADEELTKRCTDLTAELDKAKRDIRELESRLHQVADAMEGFRE